MLDRGGGPVSDSDMDSIFVIPDLFIRLGLALAIGFLIGIERGWKDRAEAEGERTAGLRTFALTGFAGGLAGALQPTLGPVAFAVLGLAACGGIAAFKWRENEDDGTHSVTTPVAAVVVFGLGALAVVGDMTVAAAGAVATAGLLGLRQVLHDWLRRMTWIELRAGLMLLAMTAVVLPLLPDRTIDPWGTINPHAIWLMAVLIGALGFVGYVAVRIGGPERGFLYAGAAGGLVSSTAVTLNHGRRAVEFPEAVSALAAGTAVAGAIAAVRALAIGVVLAPGLLALLALVLGPTALGFAGAALLLRRQAAAELGHGSGEASFANPFEAGQAIRFALLLAVVLAVSKLAAENAGPAGYVGFAMLSGVADVDALTLSAAGLATSGGLPASTAAAAIVAAVYANIVMKAVYAFASGGRGYGRLVAFASLAGMAAGGLGFLAQRAWAA